MNVLQVDKWTWALLAGLGFIGCKTGAPATRVATDWASLPYHQRVDTYIGTGGHGHTYPGATSPFGMVQLSPDSRLDGWDGCGGFHADDDTLFGFSHTHLQGTGVSDYGDILVMPCTQFSADAGPWRNRYKSAFSQIEGESHAGYHAVYLQDHKLTAQLTTTPRVGIHRYILDAPDTVTWIVDMAHRDALLQYQIEPMDDSTLVGFRVSDNWAREQHVYFAMRFDRPMDWQDALTEIETTDTLADGTLQQRMTFVPVFAAGLGVVDSMVIRVALSPVDIEGALGNLAAEAPHTDFDRYVRENTARWDDQLGRVDVEVAPGTDPEREHRVFYTALYHACTTPNLASDVDGRYRGMDQRIHQLGPEDGLQYTVFSLWDTFRALHPLLNWIEPVRSRDFVRSMLRMYDQGGALPVWELASNETNCMIGYHSVPVIMDAVRWGIGAFDQTLAWEAMQSSAMGTGGGLPAYRELGFIPSEQEHESVSKTLEYAFDDACIAWYGAALGKPESDVYRLRALSYRNLYNSATGFIQPKRGGAFVENFDPREVNFHYTEANGWQYHFFVPHDVPGLMEAMGGSDAFLERLQAMFGATSETTGRDQADITGCIGQYAHGNEPSHHVAYLPAYAGRPDLTAEWVTRILDSLYWDGPDGLSGNEDCGQMSAWYVWSALGCYPVAPGSGEVVFGTPRFQRAMVRPRGGPETVIERRGDGIYPVGLARGADRKLGAGVAVQALRDGGFWTVEVAPQPSTWGRDPDHWPGSAWPDEGFVGVPTLHAPRAFRQGLHPEGVTVSIDPPPGTQVTYRLHPSGPWLPYASPFWVQESCTVEARSIDGAGNRSATVSHPIRAISHDWKLDLACKFDNQYHAGGDQALLDGIRGGNQFKTGEWQGFYGQDVQGTVDLGATTSLLRLRLGALQDTRPWIFYPQTVRFWGSMDGRDWVLLGTAPPPPQRDDRDERPQVHRFELMTPAQVRYVRFEATTFGNLPAWHLGTGNPSWMFLDEWEIETAP